MTLAHCVKVQDCCAPNPEQIPHSGSDIQFMRHLGMKSFDTIVIGVGGMGSATLWQLARRGQKVLGIERFDLGHSMGSSHGLNRIIRLAYFEHPNYVPLLRRAYELWREAEQLTKEQLLFVTGGIDAGADDSRITCRAR